MLIIRSMTDVPALSKGNIVLSYETGSLVLNRAIYIGEGFGIVLAYGWYAYRLYVAEINITETIEWGIIGTGNTEIVVYKDLREFLSVAPPWIITGYVPQMKKFLEKISEAMHGTYTQS